MSLSPLIDTHAHLDLPDFDNDRQLVIERAKTAGLVGIVNVGFDLSTSRRSLEMARRVPGFFWASVGIHPHEALKADPSALAEIETLARKGPVVAIGEIGLDYYRDLSPRTVQRDIFRRQLDLAARLDLPVIIHSRDAMEDTLAILEGEAPPKRGILHSFSGDAPWALRAVELGFYLSFSGPLTFRKAETLRDAAAAVPLHRLLLETDCPYLAPEPQRGTRNEPSFIVHTATRLAQVLNLTPGTLADLTTANAKKILGLSDAD